MWRLVHSAAKGLRHGFGVAAVKNGIALNMPLLLECGSE